MKTTAREEMAAAAWNAAQNYYNESNWDQARSAYMKVLDLIPGQTQALLQLSYVESRKGGYRAARDFAIRAFATGTMRPEVGARLAARLRTFNEDKAVLVTVSRLLGGADISAELLVEYAAHLSYLGQHDAAKDVLDAAIRKDAALGAAYMARGQVLTYLGDFDSAELDFERCISLAPHLAQAHWFLSRVKKQSAQENHIDRLLSRLQQPADGDEDEVLLCYALHKEFDDLGDFDEAWKFLIRACHAKRILLPYESEKTKQMFDHLIGWKPNHARSAEAIVSGAVPIFIVGMHRSGTTLMEQLLTGNPSVHGIGESYAFTGQMRLAANYHCKGALDERMAEMATQVDFEKVGEGYIHAMEWRLGGKKLFTDKLPSNFLNAGYICEALPNAKIVHMSRDPVETCFSNLREIFSDVNAYSYDMEDLAGYYLQYQRLMGEWRERYPDRILDVDFEQLTMDPERVMREVCVFCGVDFQDVMLEIDTNKRGVATASAFQVRGGIRPASKKWVAYAEWLHPMIERLSEMPA